MGSKVAYFEDRSRRAYILKYKTDNDQKAMISFDGKNECKHWFNAIQKRVPSITYKIEDRMDESGVDGGMRGNLGHSKMNRKNSYDDSAKPVKKTVGNQLELRVACFEMGLFEDTNVKFMKIKCKGIDLLFNMSDTVMELKYNMNSMHIENCDRLF